MAATVLHGRRKGQARADSAPGSLQQPMMTLPDGTDLRQVTVLTQGDWGRINMQLNRGQIEAEERRRRREEKEAVKKMSKDKVKNWTNTIAGHRQKRLEARKIREEKEEAERKQVDLEEAQFQAQKRKEAIEKAKTLQYYQTDRVKGFHSALMFTEVLKEREAQLELKRLKEKAYEGKDNDWLDKQRKDYEDGIRDDQRKALQRLQEREEVAEFQKAQIREHIKDRLIAMEDDKKEGEDLKKLAIQYHLEKKRLEDIRRDEQKQNMQQNVKRIEDVKKMREIQQEIEEEEDEECRIFAAAKRKMMKLRVEKEKLLHNEKQERLEKIRDRLAAQMKQKVDDEDQRIRKATEEREAKIAKEDAEKDAKNRRMLSEMAEHRYQQMREKEEKEAAERAREMEMLQIRKEADKLFQRNEEMKHSRKFDENKHLADFHLMQAGQRKLKEDEVKVEQLQQDAKNMELLKLEEDQFQEYAGKVIDHCLQGGRNVYPLRKAARPGAGGGLGPIFEGKGGIRPSYMAMDHSGVQLPNYQRGTTEEVKKNIYGDGRTNKRLGFVWR
ncbi:coiled-coil domain-containing protein 173-like [Lingula anatina]|uniref:Coiled-coil domain-containing protein 173-like n=1 Tax=Lingula anatina TaxID=7574 RepID=A0A1S3IXI2_LINAN|nr:coiled-coil domain-containing protein 173-like [Lingula anatina]|eukprot:XP_013402738.1 coiled-coil domain-containing protein 173-like [Lingula anatina]